MGKAIVFHMFKTINIFLTPPPKKTIKFSYVPFLDMQNHKYLL